MPMMPPPGWGEGGSVVVVRIGSGRLDGDLERDVGGEKDIPTITIFFLGSSNAIVFFVTVTLAEDDSPE